MTRRKQNLTIRDIASMANVSYQAVSLVINDKPGVSDETRKRIQKLMREVDYRPNKVAQMLMTSRSKMLELVLEPRLQQVKSLRNGRCRHMRPNHTHPDVQRSLRGGGTLHRRKAFHLQGDLREKDGTWSEPGDAPHHLLSTFCSIRDDWPSEGRLHLEAFHAAIVATFGSACEQPSGPWERGPRPCRFRVFHKRVPQGTCWVDAASGTVQRPGA
jgi:transcriptional regulator with XRE-family HTH domain